MSLLDEDDDDDESDEEETEVAQDMQEIKGDALLKVRFQTIIMLVLFMALSLSQKRPATSELKGRSKVGSNGM